MEVDEDNTKPPSRRERQGEHKSKGGHHSKNGVELSNMRSSGSGRSRKKKGKGRKIALDDVSVHVTNVDHTTVPMDIDDRRASMRRSSALPDASMATISHLLYRRPLSMEESRVAIMDARIPMGIVLGKDQEKRRGSVVGVRRASAFDRMRKLSLISELLVNIEEEQKSEKNSETPKKESSRSQRALRFNDKLRMLKSLPDAARKKLIFLQYRGEDLTINPYCVAKLGDKYRRKFRLRVFSIVMLQLLLCIACVLLCVTVLRVPLLRAVSIQAGSFSPGVFFSFFLPVFTVIPLWFFRAKKYLNMVLMVCFTLSISWLISIICIYYNTSALILTTANLLLVLGVTLGLNVAFLDKPGVGIGLGWLLAGGIAVGLMYAGRALPASTCDFGISVINGSAEITPYIGWGGSSSGSIGGEGAISGSTAGEGTDEGSLPPPVEGGCGSWAAFGVSWFLSGIFITWVFFDIRTMEIDLGMDEVVIGACDIYLDVVNLFIWSLLCLFSCAGTQGQNE
mmetsp:Transcript_39909/g.102868  ORF Transcript_39909/g.102868 Transcript_39909/m.102868 type:complete len:510 (-) Transcript_39909:6400-7929(-)